MLVNSEGRKVYFLGMDSGEANEISYSKVEEYKWFQAFRCSSKQCSCHEYEIHEYLTNCKRIFSHQCPSLGPFFVSNLKWEICADWVSFQQVTKTRKKLIRNSKDREKLLKPLWTAKTRLFINLEIVFIFTSRNDLEEKKNPKKSFYVGVMLVNQLI